MLSKASITALILAGFTRASLYPGQSNLNHTCQLQTPYLSCSSKADPAFTDSCCTETYGGLVLQTQFWDTYTGLESTGQVLPINEWSIHGLWPDFCNGSYTQYCDLSRQYDPVPSPNTTNGLPGGTPVPSYQGPSIGTFLEPFGKYDLLAYMNKYWIAQNQPNADFWGHEFSKHATCFSTFDLPCYGPKHVEHSEVVDFFETTIAYYQQLPTYKWLSKEDIRPSNSSTYSLSQLQKALKKGYGERPYIGCSGTRFNETEAGKGSKDNGRTVVSEVWYYHHVLGRVQSVKSVAVDAGATGGSVSNCATTRGALKYLKRTKGSEA